MNSVLPGTGDAPGKQVIGAADVTAKNSDNDHRGCGPTHTHEAAPRRTGPRNLCAAFAILENA
jgi:hypothetical protein